MKQATPRERACKTELETEVFKKTRFHFDWSHLGPQEDFFLESDDESYFLKSFFQE